MSNMLKNIAKGHFINIVGPQQHECVYHLAVHAGMLPSSHYPYICIHNIINGTNNLIEIYLLIIPSTGGWQSFKVVTTTASDVNTNEWLQCTTSKWIPVLYHSNCGMHYKFTGYNDWILFIKLRWYSLLLLFAISRQQISENHSSHMPKWQSSGDLLLSFLIV